MTVKTESGITITYVKSKKWIIIYIQFPDGTVTFGDVADTFWGLPGVDYFTRLIHYRKETRTLIIKIPCEQDPDLFKTLKRNESEDDIYDTLIEDGEEENIVVYECWENISYLATALNKAFKYPLPKKIRHPAFSSILSIKEKGDFIDGKLSDFIDEKLSDFIDGTGEKC
ncbi:MAG: hypothetical protein LIO96_06565 [Lachnospiraceae bacterium]|nr:hypothetical protein [Lachnospiraceae bacterium]